MQDSVNMELLSPILLKQTTDNLQQSDLLHRVCTCIGGEKVVVYLVLTALGFKSNLSFCLYSDGQILAYSGTHT